MGKRDNKGNGSQRGKLDWSFEHQLTRGHVGVLIQSAEGERGKLYSLSAGKVYKDRDHMSKYFSAKDIQDMISLLEAADDWIGSALGNSQ